MRQRYCRIVLVAFTLAHVSLVSRDNVERRGGARSTKTITVFGRLTKSGRLALEADGGRRHRRT